MSGKEFMKWQNVNTKRGICLTDNGTVNSFIFKELLFYKSKSSTDSRKSSVSKSSNTSRSYVDCSI